MKNSNWVTHRKILRKKIKKILGIIKAKRVFESPILCIWQFECSVYIFRGPWIGWWCHTVKVRDWESLGTRYFLQPNAPSTRSKRSELAAGDRRVPLGCPVRPGKRASHVEFGEGSPSLLTEKKRKDNILICFILLQTSEGSFVCTIVQLRGN